MLRQTCIACSLLVSQAALAQSSVTLWGFLDDGLAYVNHSAPTGTVVGQKIYRVASSSESRWGLNGREDLGGGTQALLQLESGFNINNGGLSQGGRLFGRQSILGLQNPRFGKLVLGRDYDFGAEYVGALASSKQWAGGVGSHVGDSDNLYNSFRLNNTVKYSTPDIAGLVLGGGYAFSEQASGGTGTGFTNDRAYTFGARYQNGPWIAAAAYLQVDQPAAGNTGGSNPTGAVSGDYVNLRNIFYGPVAKQQVATAGANYTQGAFTTGFISSWVRLNYGDRTALRLMNYELNGRYKFAPQWQASVAFIYTDGQGEGGNSLGKFAVGNRPKWEQINLGVEYTLSNRTSLYGITVWQKALGDATQAAIYNAGGLSGSADRSQLYTTIGMRTKF